MLCPPPHPWTPPSNQETASSQLEQAQAGPRPQQSPSHRWNSHPHPTLPREKWQALALPRLKPLPWLWPPPKDLSTCLLQDSSQGAIGRGAGGRRNNENWMRLGSVFLSDFHILTQSCSTITNRSTLQEDASDERKHCYVHTRGAGLCRWTQPAAWSPALAPQLLG